MLSFTLLALLLVGLSNLADLADFATAKRLAGQGQHFLMLQRDGQVFGVGYDKYGQLGLDTTSNAVILPQRMLSVTNASDVSAGASHSCLIDQGSQVKCVGYNYNRQLGDGTGIGRHVLVPTLGLDSGIEEVYCGYYGSCARMTNGKAQCWGLFANLLRTSPVNITLLGGIQSMSLGYAHACIVEIGGKLYCMGGGSQGRLGTGNSADQTGPTPVVGLAAENIVSVVCSFAHTCAVNTAGAMLCWGESDNGRLGDSSITSDSPNPVQVVGITSGAASAWAGRYNSFVLMQNGTVWAFGQDNYGLFGIGSTGTKYEPIVYGQGVSGVVELRGGLYSTCVLLQNDRVWCTGDNRYGQLGVGNTTNFQTLVEMVGIPATQSPTTSPTSPTLEPTAEPTLEPTLVPTAEPTVAPTLEPTAEPTLAPTSVPTFEPTLVPTSEPTFEPTLVPTSEPTFEPTVEPTQVPTLAPTSEPVATAEPTLVPTGEPTFEPTLVPTAESTLVPTNEPTLAPTLAPTSEPTAAPTQEPTLVPTAAPIADPTANPTVQPTVAPTQEPTSVPTFAPTTEPTVVPTVEPTLVPTATPAQDSTTGPTAEPTLVPTSEPTVEPTLVPTNEPTIEPTVEPTAGPAGSTVAPTNEPIQPPAEAPTVPANSICLPVIGTDKTECATLMKTCAKSDVTMFWAGAGCRVNGILQQDGGCQCRGYCGYTCAKACNLSSGGRCKWNNNLKACTVAATGKAYVPRDSKYCPRD